MLYAIQAGEDGPIKFGVAKSPRARLAELQTGNPNRLKLLVAVEMEHRCERLIHSWLRDERLVGEWFRVTAKTLSLLEDLSIRAALGPGDQTWPDLDLYGREYFSRHPEDLGPQWP